MLEEKTIFQLISHSGDAKSLAFKALEYIYIYNDDYANAEEVMENSKNELINAYNIQTKLLQKEAAG
jgi:PTS system cellobiose-specific IIA component